MAHRVIQDTQSIREIWIIAFIIHISHELMPQIGSKANSDRCPNLALIENIARSYDICRIPRIKRV